MNRNSLELRGVDPVRLARIRPAMQKYVDSDLFAGLSTLICHHGEIVHSEQVGHADKETGRALETNTLFRIYSMTKPVTCAALMLLYEEGHFQLFDPVAHYIPSLEKLKVLEVDASGNSVHVSPRRPPTIRDLLTHTAGFSYHFAEGTPVAKLYGEIGLLEDSSRSLGQFVAELSYLPLAFHPGERWHYSVSIDVVAHLIEILTDQPFDEFLYQRLLLPLGLEDTSFFVPDEKRNRVATTYGVADLSEPDLSIELVKQQYDRYPVLKPLDVSASSPIDLYGFARGGHGLVCTIGDYLKFAQMLLGGGISNGERLLSRKTVDFMHLNHLPSELLPYGISDATTWLGYGFGLGSRVLLDPAPTATLGSVGEYGWGGAAKTYYWVDPHEDLVCILMAQKMMATELPEKDFQVLTYQALIN